MDNSFWRVSFSKCQASQPTTTIEHKTFKRQHLVPDSRNWQYFFTPDTRLRDHHLQAVMPFVAATTGHPLNQAIVSF